MSYLIENNYSIPDDVGIMCFDNIDTLKYVRPKLSSVAYPIEDIVQKAFSTLVDKSVVTMSIL